MKSNKTLSIAIGSVVIIVIIGIILQQHQSTQTRNQSTVHSPYAGQETRGIKALSQNDVEGLLTGTGTPFGGMAKPAELNGYPGPRHVLDAHIAGELQLTDEQYTQTETIYEEMRADAIKLGKQIVDIEKEINDAFTDKQITNAFLQEKVEESANLYGQLRTVHLKYHLAMVEILTPQQVEQYNELRGYNSGDPCINIPNGHNPEMWKLHNNCE